MRKRSIIITVCVVLMIGRTPIFNSISRYEQILIVDEIVLEDEVLKAEIQSFIQSGEHASVESLIHKSLEMTTRTLEFSAKSKSIDPNDLRQLQKTHCIGYAAFTTALINYGLHIMPQMKYKAMHARGEIYIFGIEVTDRSRNAFFRDHDYVIIEHQAVGDHIIVDPSLYEFTRISLME